MTAAALTVDGLRIRYPSAAGPVHAVEDVSFSVGPNESFGLVGESGSGKSSICSALLGLHDPKTSVTARQLQLGDHDLLTVDRRRWTDLRGREITLVPQHPMTALSPIVPVGKQFDWFLGADAIARHEAELREIGLDAVLERPDDLPRSFSGGQLQRLVIAIATFGRSPAVLLADEPTSTLDVTVQAAVLEVLDARRRATGSAMVFVSHDLAVVAKVCDRVGVMRHGRLVEVADVDTLFSSPQHDYTKALIGAAVPSRRRRAAAGSEGTSSSADPAAGAAAAVDLPTPVLEVDRLYHYFGRTTHRRAPVSATVVRAVDEVDLSIAEGEVRAIVGESGSGKTTLARVIAGALIPTAGSVRLDGVELSGERSTADRRHIQLVAQNTRAALNPRRQLGHVLVQAQRVHSIGTDQADRVRRATAMLERVGLSADHLGRRPRRLSGGELARAVLARSLLLEPRLLVLDEPTASLDAQVKRQVLDLIGDLRDELALTVLVITHELGTARAIADTVTVMHEGRVIEAGSVEQVLSDPAEAYTRRLLASELHLTVN